MSYLFGRLARLTIGVPGQQGRLFESFSRDPETGLLLPGLRFSFSIEKTSEALPNKMSIDLYNLNEDSVAITKKKGATVVLEAGYGSLLTTKWANDNSYNPSLLSSTLAVIYVGDIAKSHTIKRGPDWVTTIESGDGLSAFQDSQLDASFGAGASLSSVVTTAIGAMGLGKGNITMPSGGYINGFSFSGHARDALTLAVDKGNSEWSIQDGLVQIVPRKKATTEEIVFLDADSGLVGSPSHTAFSNAELKNFGKNAGIQFASLLQPSIKPGRRVKIASKKVNGIFVPRKVTHRGDTKQGAWSTEVEALEP